MDHEPPAVLDLPAPGPVDLTDLERIEAELAAVERALERIDQGVYEGFAGIDEAQDATAAQ